MTRPAHTTDADCTLDAADDCIICGVHHDEPCPACAGTGFHNEGCPLSDDTPAEPEAEDLITEDHITFYEVEGLGRCVLEVDEDEDWREAVRRHMDLAQFWPNVWFLSDHGNAHLITDLYQPRQEARTIMRGGLSETLYLDSREAD